MTAHRRFNPLLGWFLTNLLNELIFQRASKSVFVGSIDFPWHDLAPFSNMLKQNRQRFVGMPACYDELLQLAASKRNVLWPQLRQATIEGGSTCPGLTTVGTHLLPASTTSFKRD